MNSDAFFVRIWVGNYGDYIIPKEFHDVRITKNGWPDKRSKKYDEFIAWAEEQERQAICT